MSTQVQFKDYSMGFKDDDGKVYNLIDHLNMQLDEGKALGIVGESGCGKSMTSLSLMRLLPAAASVQGGEILLNGEDLLKKSEPEMEKIRGKQIAMIFQEPMTALNPVMTIGKQIGECLKLHHPEMKEDEIPQILTIGTRSDAGAGSPSSPRCMWARAFPMKRLSAEIPAWWPITSASISGAVWWKAITPISP